jgi:hypothetical protein
MGFSSCTPSTEQSPALRGSFKITLPVRVYSGSLLDVCAFLDCCGNLREDSRTTLSIVITITIGISIKTKKKKKKPVVDTNSDGPLNSPRLAAATTMRTTIINNPDIFAFCGHPEKNCVKRKKFPTSAVVTGHRIIHSEILHYIWIAVP